MAPPPDPSGSTTSFWELSGIALSIIQMIFYIYYLEKYYDKLTDVANELIGFAEEDEKIYWEFRDLDPDFYDWYKNFPEHKYCPDLVQRARGTAYHEYGKGMRAFLKKGSAVNPMAAVNYSGALEFADAPKAALQRIVNDTAEHQREDKALLTKWETIVSIPVGEEGNPTGYGPLIEQYFKSFNAFGKGFNSGATMFGRLLYGAINDA